MQLAHRFHQLFNSLDRAHGVHVPDTTGNPGKKKGKSWTDPTPPTVELWQQHLDGKKSLGLVPIRDDSTCLWAAIDIDDYTIDLKAFEATAHEVGLPCALCRTKSGGAHLYLFFSEPVPAKLVRTKLTKFCHALSYPAAEVFPKQDNVDDPTASGNWLNMPFFHAELTTRYCYCEDGRVASAEQFLEIAEKRKIDMKTLLALEPQLAAPVDDPGFSDAPPCLEHLTKIGFTDCLNNALFSMGVYARKKFPNNWEDKVGEYNHKFMGPGTFSEVQAIVKSLHKKGYCYKCNDVPLNQHCNKEECFKRKYGLDKPGRKNSREGRSCILDEMDRPGKCFVPSKGSGDEPVWEFTMGGHAISVSMDTLMNQRAFMREFLRVFRRLILLVKEDVWVDAVNDMLSDVEEIEAPVDAGPEGQLMLHLEAFCTGKIQARDRTELILGKPFTGILKDHHVTPMCWFRSKDFVKYLDQQHFREFSSKEIYPVIRRRGAKHTTIMMKGTCVAVWGVGTFATQTEDFDMVEIPVECEGDKPF